MTCLIPKCPATIDVSGWCNTLNSARTTHVLTNIRATERHSVDYCHKRYLPNRKKLRPPSRHRDDRESPLYPPTVADGGWNSMPPPSKPRLNGWIGGGWGVRFVSFAIDHLEPLVPLVVLATCQGIRPHASVCARAGARWEEGRRVRETSSALQGG